MTIQVSEVKNIIRCIVDEQKVVFITIWPTASETGIIVELAHGPKVSLIHRGTEFNLVKRFKEIGIKVDILEASHIAHVIRQHLNIL